MFKDNNNNILADDTHTYIYKVSLETYFKRNILDFFLCLFIICEF